MHMKMNNIFIAAIVLLNSSTIFGMEQTEKYDAWKRISLSKRWRNSNCADGAEMGLLEVKMPSLQEEVKFQHGTTLEIEEKQSVTWLAGNTTIVEWPRQKNNTVPYFFYPILCIEAPKLSKEHDTLENVIKFCYADKNTTMLLTNRDKKSYSIQLKSTGKRGNYRAFTLICNLNNMVYAAILKEDKRCAFGKIDTCNLGFLTGVQYEFETKTSYLFWMDPLVPSNYPHLRVKLSGELKPKDFDKIYLSYTPDGTYCTFIYNNTANTPICLIWFPRSRGTFFDEHFAKLENTYFNFK